MSFSPQPRLSGRNTKRLHHDNTMAKASNSQKSARLSKRARFGQRNQRLPYMPPENWNEPQEDGSAYRFIVQHAGQGYRHVLTPAEVRERLSVLPAHFVAPLEVVQFSQMTRKKTRFPCYGMQWGTTLYLYPVEAELVENFANPPTPAQYNEARMYGGRWECDAHGNWKLHWTEQTIKDFYLNNILIHELGHLLDNRNNSSVDRERYAEWFALEYGYKPTRHARAAFAGSSKPRHGKKSYHAVK